MEVAFRGSHLCVLGEWRKGMPETMAELAKLLDDHKSKKVTSILLIDPSVSASEARTIAKDWSDESRQFKLKSSKRKSFEFQVWDALIVRERLRQVPALELRYFADEIPGGRARLESIEAVRRSYLEQNRSAHGKIQFVGMSVYKEEATSAVDLESLYIPLHVVSEGANEYDPATQQRDPLRLLAAGERHVILGDPGSGKSTLLKFLAIAAHDESLRKRFQIEPDGRLPILVILRELAEALRDVDQIGREFDLLDYVLKQAAAQLGLPVLDREFFEFFLLAGKAVLFFDGIDELPGLESKREVRRRIGTSLTSIQVTRRSSPRGSSAMMSRFATRRWDSHTIASPASRWTRSRNSSASGIASAFRRGWNNRRTSMTS